MRFVTVTDFSSILLRRLSRRSVQLTCGGVLLGAAGMMPSYAAEMVVSDLRLSFGILSTDFRGSGSATITDSNDQVSTSSGSNSGRNADDNYRLQIQYVNGHLGNGGGFIWGIGAAVNRATWENGNMDAHSTTPIVNIRLGYGYAITPNWHFELTPFGGYGQTFYSVSSDNSSSTQKERDHYFEYGASIGTYYGFDSGLVLGIEVPYLAGHFDPDYNYDDNNGDTVTVSDKHRNQGFGVLASVGYRF